MTNKQPEALRQAAWLKREGASCQRHYDLGVLIERQHAELETLRARVQELEAHLILDCMTHVQKPSEIEHVAGDVSKNGAESNMTCASHGQASAQAAPACKDSTPELHVGDSAFESWYSAYSPAHKGDKQRARDAYAAGMGDPLVTAAPTAVAGPWSAA